MRPKKHLGQHFLTAPTFARRIAEAVPEKTDKENVLEIGPGKGALSIYLKERFPDFHLVEVDSEAIEQLRAKLGEGSYTIHHADVLEFDFSTTGFPLHVVGNLPYSIGAMIIKKTLLLGNNILSCTFMVQREVAERIVSAPHSKTNGFLSIFCSFFGTPRILFHVPPGAFFPRPNVESSVFQIITDKELDKKLEPSCWEPFFSFVSKGFSQRRKQLSKVLGNDQATKEKIRNHLMQLGLDPLSRPEDLGVNEWLSLFKLR
ncbi:MAG: ribosomal RNA small subunit methyltransferase A [Fibrobacter sp.]|jgi:16S rRNA (adenine1518-N6/adenine1519-N6)-dimethyltransferase|nr:ribosomal RNA small subunit methyltransferase A [Fibrobacter sp.]